jgi:gliding motility-associated-like protein
MLAMNFNIIIFHVQFRRRLVPVWVFMMCLLTFSTSLQADEYYWVGGNGVWSDINHWATSSGGSVLHIKAPTAVDNVHFDVNSFPSGGATVIINQKNAVCRDMLWQNVQHNPVLDGTDTTSLRIYGSLQLAPGMSMLYDGVMFMEATTPGQTITTAGHLLNCNVVMHGNGGGWELSDNYNSIGTLNLLRGSFKTNNLLLQVFSFESSTTEPRTILLGTSQVKVYDWMIDGTNLMLDAALTTFSVSNSLTTQQGGRFIYNNAFFTGTAGALSSTGATTVFNLVTFADGSVSGQHVIDSLFFAGTGTISGSDSIKYVQIASLGQINLGPHYLKYVQCEANCIIDGTSFIDSLFVEKDATIKVTNTIDYAFIKGNASILGENIINSLTILKFANIQGYNIFQFALLGDDGFLAGANNFDDLTLTAGRTYTLGSHSTQTINSSLTAPATCYAPIRMLTDTNGVQATITKYNGAFESEYLSLRDIKADGSIPFLAAHSVDRGNNTNWNIQTSAPKDLYWVNGTGQWSDPTHWDMASGGAGGECPPTEIDNAWFDGNSFSLAGQNVNIDVRNAVCADMNWENIAVSQVSLKGAGENNLRINGSLFFHQNVHNDFPGQFFFEAVDSDNIIRSAGNKYNTHAWFEGRNGFWSLEDDFEAQLVIYFKLGGIDTRGNKVTCSIFQSPDTTTRQLYLSTSVVELRGQGGQVWNLCSMNLTLKADSSLLKAMKQGVEIVSFGPFELTYNNVEFHDRNSRLNQQGVYCRYNLVTFYDKFSKLTGDCKIDTLTCHGQYSKVYDSDSIRAAIFYADSALIQGGKHQIDIAYFYGEATVRGNNTIDTALFYKSAIIRDTNIFDTAIVYNKTYMYGTNTFGTATLLGDGFIDGTHIFDDLTLTKTRTYYFENGKTQTINNNLNLHGACTGPIILQSDENTRQAILQKTNGGVVGEYLSLRDIKAEGDDLPFVANNSVDLGNNPGWEINSADALALYWVGGSGNWSDSLHWAGTSGGAGGYCIPTPVDDVFFDENSFFINNDSVWVDMGNATCHSMYWTGALSGAEISGPDTNNLRVYGSLTLNAEMFFKFQGALFFETTEPDHFVQSFGVTIESPITFQGIGGEWRLLDALQCEGGITFKHGTLDLDGNSLVCAWFDSDFTSQRALNIADASVYLSADNRNAWNLNIRNLVFDGAESRIISHGNNGLVRTIGVGDIAYHNMKFTGSSSRIYTVDSRAYYDNIIFDHSGEVHGNCTIDTLLIQGLGSVFDADTISFAHIRGNTGTLSQSSHVIQTILFDHAAQISGSNSIDSTIIFGAGTITGQNTVTKTLIIGGKAVIGGTNDFGHTTLMSNGKISGTNDFRSLKLTPGNLYELQESKTQTIGENFYIRGNNCFPITLRSQKEGEQAFVSVPAPVIVSGDYIEIRDVNATGGAVFYAGNFSTDISNNDGWLFANAPGYIYGFANDTTVCASDVSIIKTDNFNPDAHSTFLWHDGSTDSEYLVTPPDTLVWVTVFYADDCAYTDSLAINWLPSPFVEMGDDIVLCGRDTLYPLQHSENISYQWFDGSTSPFMLTDATGVYSLTVTNAYGCTATDAIFVEVIPTPIVDLGADTMLRAGEQLLLDAGNPDAHHYWSTGDTTQSILVQSDGTYWVQVSIGGCVGSDTISIGEYPPCTLVVPTAFSPNGDGQNDVLYVRGSNFTEFELLIFNRWGEMVFRTRDASSGWDGTFQGEDQAMDAYQYLLRGKCIDGQITTSKGTITLLR